MEQFFKDLAERAIKTFAQAIIQTLTGVAAFHELNIEKTAFNISVLVISSIATSLLSFSFGKKGTASLVDGAESVFVDSDGKRYTLTEENLRAKFDEISKYADERKEEQ
ncbi:hypothetical protein FACS1894111_05520 [Clostridia bacterium]|nr:hypothetical protein FACS1894111_05520 [Clostridia bacterium]